jgi:hypothetical protein
MKILTVADGGRRASILAWLAALAGAAVFVVLTVAAGVLSMLRPSPEVATLRDCVMASAEVEREIEARVGPIVFGALRAGLNFVELEPEVRPALGAVRGASVGVYRVEPGLDRATLADAVDEAMTRRGWERVVGVLEGNETVLVYGPAKMPSTRDLRLSVLVLDGEQLVLASVRGNPEPIAKLLLNEAARHCPRASSRLAWQGERHGKH